METILPKTKVAARVPRAFAGLNVFISSAMGGPPMEVEVPRKPDKPPAIKVFGALTLGVHPKELKIMVKMTAPPIKSCREFVVSAAGAHYVRKVPSTRAQLEQSTLFQSVSAPALSRVEQAFIRARHSTTTGTIAGFNSAMMGEEIVPNPNPMTPWTVEPIKIMS